MRKNSNPGWVYVAHCQGLHKIGYTTGPPSERIRSLQTGNPFPIELVGAIPGEPQDEIRFHGVFKSKRVSGEWFLLTEDDVKSILERDWTANELEDRFYTFSPKQRAWMAYQMGQEILRMKLENEVLREDIEELADRLAELGSHDVPKQRPFPSTSR